MIGSNKSAVSEKVRSTTDRQQYISHLSSAQYACSFIVLLAAYVTQAALIHITKCAYSGVACIRASVSNSYMARSHDLQKC
jgi:hypothetical protein